MPAASSCSCAAACWRCGHWATAPGAVADKDVALFLGKKSHIVATEDGFAITEKGRESLADIEALGM